MWNGYYAGEGLDDVRCISINPNGDVIVCCFPIGNIYQDSITDIIGSYNPHKNPYTDALIDGGVCALIKVAEKEEITVNTSQHYSACGMCREIMDRVCAR